MPGPIPASWSARLLSVLRVVAAFFFMLHGTQKLFALPIAEPREPAALFSLMGLAGTLEFFGGILLLLGLFTRPVAFVLAGENGCGVLREPRAARVLAHTKRGRAGGSLLFSLPVSGLDGSRPLEPGRHEAKDMGSAGGNCLGMTDRVYGVTFVPTFNNSVNEDP